ncbi:DUF5084 family protein [Staphylococcus caprae]
MKHTWWISLAISCMFGLFSSYGIIVGVGALGMIALNLILLVIYTPHQNIKVLESIAKSTTYLAIIGTYLVFVLMNAVFYLIVKETFKVIGIRLYGDLFNKLGIISFILSIVLFTLGTWLVLRTQQQRLKIK